MKYLRQIQRGIDYIEEHLDEEIELSEVSRVAGVSHWHFQRIFRALTNETPKTYVRSRRLAQARVSLLNTDTSILEISIRAGFNSQASFTRTFRDAFGLPPARYRSLRSKHGSKHLFLEKVRFDDAYLRHIHKNLSPTPTIERAPTRRMVGLPTRFYSVDSERNNIAAQLPSLWAAFVPRLQEIEAAIVGTCYGIVRQAELDGDLLEYTAAMATGPSKQLPEGMVQLEIPEATYAVFTHRGDPATLDHTVNYIYSTWLLQSGMRHSYGADLEIYGSEYAAGSETSVMYYAIPIVDDARGDE